MTNIKIFKDCCYNPSFFKAIKNGSVLITEKANTGAESKLQKVNISIPDNAIKISNNILRKSSDIYRKITEYDSNYSFRSDCDGILLIKKNDVNYLITIELKSGYNEVRNKAIYQLVVSDIKIMNYLNLIIGFEPTKCKHIGLVFSYPPAEITSNSELIQAKQDIIMNPYGTTANKCDYKFRNHQSYKIDPEDFFFNNLNLKAEFCPTDMLLTNIQVPKGQKEFSYDLNKMIGPFL